MKLVQPKLDAILAFCAEAPIERVFLEDVARRGLGRFAGVTENGRLVALCHLGANVWPAGERCDAFASAAAKLRPATRMVIGEERAVTEFWEAARRRMRRPREDRPGQPVFAIHEPPEPGETGLRAATVDDLEFLLPACAEAHREEIGVDPLGVDPDAFRWRTRTQIEEGRSWLWEANGVILFKAEVSSLTPHAAQIQQVWVDPVARGNGYAQRGMRDLCRLLLARVPSVCLFVRPENTPAIRVYEAIGMNRVLTYRSLVF